MMDRRYQVFVSSTFEDLRRERQHVMQALLQVDCFPAGMELFPATDDNQWTLIKRVIDESDYYLVIVGGRYGSLGPGDVAYTEMEYDYAVAQGKPVLGFVHKNPGQLAAERTEQTDAGRHQYARFCEKVKRRACRLWSTGEDLEAAVITSLVKETKLRPMEGWVRARDAADPREAAELLRLNRRVQELEAEARRRGVTAPASARGLEDGDELFSVACTYWHLKSSVWSNFRAIYTWDDYLRMIGPRLFAVVAESSLRNFLQGYIFDKKGAEFRVEANSIEVEYEGFQTLLTQFAALGYIDRVDVTGSIGEVYWTLTPRGQARVTSLLAVRKERPKKRRPRSKR